MGRTPKVVEDRREQIMDAAMRVFAQKGFSGATNKDIANEARITPGLIYHYFDSKDALLREIIAHLSALRNFSSLPPAMLSLPIRPLLQQIALKILATVEEEQYVELIKIILPEAIHHPQAVSPGISDMQEAVRFIEKILQMKMDSGEIKRRETALPAQVFLSSILGFVLRRQVFQDVSVLHYTHEEIANSVVNMIVHELE